MTTNEALDVQFVWPDEAEAFEPMGKNAEEFNRIRGSVDPAITREAVKIAAPYLRRLSPERKQQLATDIRTAIRTTEDLAWLRAGLEGERRARLARDDALEAEREFRMVPSRIYQLVDAFNEAMRLPTEVQGYMGRTYTVSAPRGYVDGPEPTDDDLDLAWLEKYLATVKPRSKLAAMARRQVVSNMLQRNPSRSPHAIASVVGIRPKDVYAIRKAMRSSGLIPPE